MNQQKTQSSRSTISNTSTGWEPAVVMDVSMHFGKDVYEKNGEAGLGWVKFRRIRTDKNTAIENLEWAKPIDSVTRYPVKTEIVLVTAAPTAPDTYFQASDTKYPAFYYTGPINHSMGINHNAAPIVSDLDASPALGRQSNRYEEQTNSAVERPPELETVSNKYGVAFNPAYNIYPLQPLYGDSIISGRWGNSIRLSCSQPNPEGFEALDPTKGYLDNPWSDNENNVGEDPILILRNGQSDLSRDITKETDGSLEPMFEDLNEDKSSIWLTDGQTINSLNTLLNNTGEDGTGVTTTNVLKANGLGNVYNDYGKATPQVIIASDRLIFASKDDEILLLGKNGIGLAADNDIVIESNDTVTISAPVIELIGEVKYGTGGKAIDGEKLIELLEDLIDEVMGLSVITATGPGAAQPSPALQGIKDRLDEALSSGDDQA